MRHLVLSTAWVAALAIGTTRPAAAAEICGNGIDDDANGMADEGCNPKAVTGICASPHDCSITGTVAPRTGALTYPLPPDLEIKVPRGPGLTFRRVYTSLYEPGGSAPAYRTPLGPRWQHNYMSWIDKGTSNAVLHFDGRDVYFAFDKSQGGYSYYKPQAGFHVSHLRQKNTSPNQWELRLLTGEVYVYAWSAPTAKLIEIRDALATPNVQTIAYDGGGQISTVTDASGKKRLKFNYTGSVVSSLEYQTIDGGTPTTRVTVAYGYASGHPTSVTIGGTLRQSMSYVGGYLDKVYNDALGFVAVELHYVDGSPGTVARSMSEPGGVGYEYDSSRSACSGGTVVFFNQVGTSACTIDADCGSDHLCGGKTDPSAVSVPTGVCFRAARCLQLSSPHEDLIDTISPLPATTCTGSCVQQTEYAWSSTAPEVTGVKEADGTWTSYQRNANGRITLKVQGDTDSDPTNAGGYKTWFFYGNASFPGRVTEVRTLSELKAAGPSPACNQTTTTDCKRTIYTWNSSGLLATRQELGFTIDASGAVVSYSYSTSYTYDSAGRLTRIDGPLAGADDVTDLTYWSSSDVLKDGYLKEVKRKKDSSNYLVQTFDGYDYWGNATSQEDPDGTYTCSTYDAARGVLTQEREAMAGQTSCASPNSADLTTTYTYDAWPRLVRTQLPLGNCSHREYDVRGRLAKIKERDDCNLAMAGDTIEYSYVDWSSSSPTDQLMQLDYRNQSGVLTKRDRYSYHDGMQKAEDFNMAAVGFPTAPSRSFAYTVDGLLDQLDFEMGLGKTSFLYDELNRQEEIRRYKTGSTFDAWTSSFAHLSASPVAVTDDDDKTMETITDDLGRRVKVVSPDAGTTLTVYDAASRMITKVEAFGAPGQVSHAFTYDNLGRMLTADYGTENCGTGAPVEIEYAYDAAPVTCPTGATCSNQPGRLAYVRSTLLCSTAYPDNTLDQEVFYAYDAAGRVIQEYLQDDSGRTAPQSYLWDKNGNNTRVTMPSGTFVQWTYGGGTGNNSDTDKIRNMQRDSTFLVTNAKWLPFGPLFEYVQANLSCYVDPLFGPVCANLRARLAWNVAYRPVEVHYDRVANPVTLFKVNYAEDAKGRTTSKTYTNAASGVQSTWLQYDWQDRLLCDSGASGTCPTSGSNLKVNVNGSPPYTASSDRTQVLLAHPWYGTRTYAFSLVSGKDQIASFTTSPSTGTTSYAWDDRGNRTSDDSSAHTNDARNYYYEGRSQLREYWTDQFGGVGVTNAYDHKGRRVFKSATVSGLTQHWFFYYDLDDRLIEIKHVPDLSSPSDYVIYQFFWIGDRPVALWELRPLLGTVTRRFVHPDHGSRVLEMWSWPTTGSATRVWAINPNAYSWDDEILIGSGVFQPLRGNGQYYDREMLGATDSSGYLRPPLHLERGGRYYDPQTATALQPARNQREVRSYEALTGACATAQGSFSSFLLSGGLDDWRHPTGGWDMPWDSDGFWTTDDGWGGFGGSWGRGGGGWGGGPRSRWDNTRCPDTCEGDDCASRNECGTDFKRSSCGAAADNEYTDELRRCWDLCGRNHPGCSLRANVVAYKRFCTCCVPYCYTINCIVAPCPAGCIGCLQ
jgi:hypothetical protein